MFVVTATVSLLLAAAMAWSAVRKLTHRADVVRTYRRVGVPEERLDALAAVLFIGAAGLLAGVWWGTVGVVAAAGVLCYFLAAVAAHVRAGDTANLASPLVLAVLAAVVLALHLAVR